MTTHAFSLRVYFEDTDAAGIVYYANYLKFADRARTEYWRSLGIDHVNILKEKQLSFVVVRCVADYKLSARLDDLLTVYTTVEDLKGARITLKQEIYRKEVVVVKIIVDLAFINLKTNRPQRIWGVVRDALKVHNYNMLTKIAPKNIKRRKKC